MGIGGPWAGTYHTDCKNLEIGWLKGEAVCTDAFNIYSGIWRVIWRKARDIGVNSIVVKWMPAHTSKRKAEEAGLAEWERQGNHWADVQAKKGARLHPAGSDDICERWHFRAAFLRWLVRFQVELHSVMFKKNLVDYAWPMKTQKDKREGQLIVTCVPTKPKVQRRKPHRSHALVEVGKMVFCRLCGYWSEHRLVNLGGECDGGRMRRGHPAYQLRLSRLFDGIHPVTRAALPTAGRSWLGLLEEPSGHKDIDEGTDVKSGPKTRAELAAAAHDHRFLTGALPTGEADFDRMIKALGDVVTGAAPRPRNHSTFEP